MCLEEEKMADKTNLKAWGRVPLFLLVIMRGRLFIFACLLLGTVAQAAITDGLLVAEEGGYLLLPAKLSLRKQCDFMRSN